MARVTGSGGDGRVREQTKSRRQTYQYFYGRFSCRANWTAPTKSECSDGCGWKGQAVKVSCGLIIIRPRSPPSSTFTYVLKYRLQECQTGGVWQDRWMPQRWRVGWEVKKRTGTDDWGGNTKIGSPLAKTAAEKKVEGILNSGKGKRRAQKKDGTKWTRRKEKGERMDGRND